MSMRCTAILQGVPSQRDATMHDSSTGSAAEAHSKPEFERPCTAKLPLPPLPPRNEGDAAG